VAYTDSFTINEDTLISSVLSGSDLEGGVLTYIIDQSVSRGVLTLSTTGAFIYTPSANFNGVDSFTFHVYDGEFSSTVVPVSITINSVNDIPLATNDGLTIVEDTNGNINPILNDTDADGDALSLSTYTQ
jgi:VCBS repeat-containing protein